MPFWEYKLSFDCKKEYYRKQANVALCVHPETASNMQGTDTCQFIHYILA